MKTLNQKIDHYTALLQQGEIQTAYLAILQCVGKLRAGFAKQYPASEVSGIYQGYLDMSYFSLAPVWLKEKGLKIAIVYLHEKGAFEAWLSARNRAIASQYRTSVPGRLPQELAVFHDAENLDAIIECTLASAPDFEDQEALQEQIEQGVASLLSALAGIV